MDTVDAIGRNVLASPLAADRLSVVWHAGEPTTVPVDWYDQAFRRLAAAAPAKRLDHSFQTNGVAINDRWIDLWRRWNVRVGISIDGPKELNDRYRRTRKGGGSFDAAIAGLRRLRTAGYPFHVISVLTAASLQRPDALVGFYREEGVSYVCFNVEEKEGAHSTSSLFQPGAVDAYRSFLRRFAKIVSADGLGPRCREIDGVAGLAAGTPESRRRNPQVAPLEIVSIAVDGGMSTFSPELLGVRSEEFDDFVFGNVLCDPVEAILENPAFRRLSAQIDAGVAACARTCAYFGLCGGGAPANKFFEHGRFAATETLFCSLTRKAVIDAILPELEANHGVDA